MKKFISILTLVAILFLMSGSTIATAVTKKSVIHTKKVGTAAIVEPAPVPVDPIYTKWFEFLNGAADYWSKDMTNNTYSGSFSETVYSNEGMPAYRFELRKTDPIVMDGKRSEIERADAEEAASENTYKFSVLLPDGGSEDYARDPEGDEIIAQWHNTPDPGEEWTYPPLSLHIQGDGHYYLWRIWDSDPLTTDQKIDSEGKKEVIDLGSYLDDKGKWTDWTFHVKWGWLTSQHPIIEVYKNGSKACEIRDKPNTTNDIQGVRMQCGIYKWQWGHPDVDQSILTNRVVYFSSVSA